MINILKPTNIKNIGKRYYRYPGPYAIDNEDLEYIFPGILNLHPNNQLPYQPGNLNNVNLSLLNRLVAYYQPLIILEIGTFDGRTTYNMYMNSPNSSIISIDLEDTPREYNGPDVKYIEHKDKDKWLKDIKDESIIKIKCDSTSQKCLNILKNILVEEKIDFAFIDGGHSYKTVKHDFEELVLPNMIDNGIVVFDDYNNLISEIGVTSYLTEKAREDNYLFYWYAPTDRENSNEVIFINNVACRNNNWRDL